VQRILAANRGRIGERWSDLDVPLTGGHRYRVRRLLGTDFGGHDPFKLLAEADPDARAGMARETLVAIGATFAGKPGFILLSDHASLMPLDRAAGEGLLDHSCAVLGARP
jgi:CDP-diacylglycerol pyrophosphatase